MKRKMFFVVLSSLVLAAVGAAPEAKTPDAKTEVQKFAPFAGEWTINGTWADGRAIYAHNVNAWTLSNTHLSGQTFVGEGAEKYQRYQSMFSYDAKHGCLVTYSFAADGAVSAYRVDTEDGKTFKFGFSPIAREELPKVRQTIIFKSADEYQWIVELNADGKWSQIMDGIWKRDEPAKEK